MAVFGKKTLFGRNFERGVVGHFPASMIIFFGLQGQVMDIRKQWGWSPNIFLTFPYYPLLSPHPTIGRMVVVVAQ